MKIKVIEENDEQRCQRCSRCCTYFCMEIDEPESKREYDDLAWIIAHEGVAIHISEGDWQLIVYNRCRHLMTEGGCAIYERRPSICREHVPGDCERDQTHRHDYDDVEHVFTTIEDLWNYRDEMIRKNRSEGAKRAAKTRKRKARQRAKGQTLTPCNEGESPVASGPDTGAGEDVSEE